MHPILFEVPGIGFPIKSFGVLVAVGFLLGTWIATRLARRYGDDPQRDPDRIGEISTWVLVGVVLGARAMFVTVEILKGSADGQGFLREPWRMLAIWEGGLAMYGGLFGAIAAGLWKAKRLGVRPLRFLDVGLVAGFFGQAVGRVGCFLVGDDYGKVVPESLRDLPWPIVVHVPDPLPAGSLFDAANAGQVLWATQNWMSLKALLVAGVGWWVLGRRRYGGEAALWMILVYSALRFAVEHFRGDLVRGVWFEGALSSSQIIALVAGTAAIALLIRNRGRREEIPAAPAASA